MNAARLMRRRARAHLGLLALVGLQVALTTAAVAGAVGYVNLAERDGLTSTLAAADPRDATLRVQADLGDDPAAQDAAATAILEDTLGGLPVTVHRSLASVTLPATAGTAPAPSTATTSTATTTTPTADDADLGPVILWHDAELPDAAQLVSGTWPDAALDDTLDTAAATGTPTSPAPTAVHADAAARAGLDVGDTLTVSTGAATSRTLEVVGLWLPTDPDDPRWFADPLIAGGVTADGATLGPFVVTEPLLVDLESVTSVRWTLVPDVDALLPADVPRVRDALTAATTGLDDSSDVDVHGLATTGGLDTTLATLETRLGGVRGVTTAAVLLVVLTGLIALSQMARLLADVRLPETLILRSRGTSVTQVTGASALEACVIGTGGAALGTVVAALALRTVGNPPAVTLLVIALASALATTGVLAWRAGSHALGVVRRGRSDAAGRNQRAVGAGVVGLTVAGAALAWWQLDRYGTPVFTGLDGRVHVDPLAASAVALGLLALGLAAALALAPASGAAARRAGRRRDLMPVLTLRELARHTPAHAVTVVLVVLATGAGAVAATYAGTLREWRADVAQAAVGADVVVDLAPHDTGAVPLAAQLRALQDVDAAAPVRVLTLGAGGEAGELVAVVGGHDATSPDADATGPDAGSASSGHDAATDPATAAVALPVPLFTPQLRITAAFTTGLAEPPALTARVWLTDDAGELLVLDAGRAQPDAAEYTWTLDVPGDPTGSYPTSDPNGPLGAWAIAAIDLVYSELPDVELLDVGPAGEPLEPDPLAGDAPPQPDVTLTLTGLTADDTTDLLADAPTWTAVRFGDAGGERVETSGTAITLDRATARESAGTPLRLLPGADAGTLPVVVTSGWLAGTDITSGASTPMTVGGEDVDTTIVGEVAVVPGTTAAGEDTVPGTTTTARSSSAGRGGTDGADATRPPLAATADLRAVNRLLLEQVADVPAPDAIRVTTDRPDAVAAAVVTPDPTYLDPATFDAATVRTAAPGTDILSTPPLVAMGLAAVFALVVMLPGVASTALALALTRRRETAVLRALGVGPGQQARARRAELALVAAIAVLGGVVGGLVVGRLCVPALVRATAAGPAALGVDLVPDPLGLAGAVGGAVALLALVITGYGGAVARRARSDSDAEESS